MSNPPAFPRATNVEGNQGMTLRDYFAAAVAPAIILNNKGLTGSEAEVQAELSQVIFQMANAMLKARLDTAKAREQ